MARPRTVLSSEIPAHLRALLDALAAQPRDEVDRVKAMEAVEETFGVQLSPDLEEEQAEYPDFAEAYQRWWRRVTMGLQDQAVSAALAGKGSATGILRGLGHLRGVGRGNGRHQLGDEHSGRAVKHERW